MSEKPKTFRAVVTSEVGEPVEVEYPADAADPYAAALKAAEAKIGKRIYCAVRIRHDRNEVPPSSPSTT